MVLVEYFGETGTLTVVASGTSYSVGVVKGIEFTAEFTYKELYGMNSIFRQAVSRSMAKVPVRIQYAAFDGKLLGAILGTSTASQDMDGSTASGRTRAAISDSSTVPLFMLKCTVTGGTGGAFKARVDEVYFENVPFVVPEDDFVMLNLTGIGARLYLEYAT